MNNSLTLITCACHVIDPTKIPVLVWMKNNKPLVKIANQTFVGQTRTDKKGEVYWKCKDFLKDNSLSLEKKELNAVEKFQTRQEKTTQITEN